MTNNWRPIATAPRDGKKKLLWDGSDYTIGFWVGVGGDGQNNSDGWFTGWEIAGGHDAGYAYASPTHWMPLPEPPEGDG